jgi:hypothetical protein
MMGTMLVEHRGKRPMAHESAWVAPIGLVCGFGSQIGRDGLDFPVL